jgi:hypothetical protein
VGGFFKYKYRNTRADFKHHKVLPRKKNKKKWKSAGYDSELQGKVSKRKRRTRNIGY